MPTVAEVIAEEKKGIPRCVVGKALYSFGDDERWELDSLLGSQSSANVVKRVFDRLGHAMSETAIKKHRSDECCCP